MNLFLKLGDCCGVEAGHYGDGYEPNKVCTLKKAVCKYTTFIFKVCSYINKNMYHLIKLQNVPMCLIAIKIKYIGIHK